MLASRKQIVLLQFLTDRAEKIRQKHPSLIPDGLYYERWTRDMTSEKASLRIQMYQSILAKADLALYPRRQVSTTVDDLPE